MLQGLQGFPAHPEICFLVIRNVPGSREIDQYHRTMDRQRKPEFRILQLRNVREEERSRLMKNIRSQAPGHGIDLSRVWDAAIGDHSVAYSATLPS
jgi:hypothetical protein